MSNKSLVSNSSKTLLKNVIRHTDSHNKIIEENEMWRQWKTEQQGPEENNPSFLKGQCSDMRYEFPKRRNKRAYMDEEPQSTFWMKELYKTEEADENRWGHNGYKELYPEQFGSSRSLTHTSSTLRATHHTERHKKTKSQKHKKKRKHKSSKKCLDRSHTEDSYSECGDTERIRKQKKTKHIKCKSDSDSETGSDHCLDSCSINSEIQGKKRKKKINKVSDSDNKQTKSNLDFTLKRKGSRKKKHKRTKVYRSNDSDS